jgi:hypothetical protein
MCVLYKLTFKSGKSYIGQTVNSLEKRMSRHRAGVKAGSMLPVHCAWRVHGAPAVEVLGVYGSHDELHAAEVAAIAEHGTLAPGGYNLGLGGETSPSRNPEVAAKIGSKVRGQKRADTSLWKALTTARWESPEYRQKVSDGLKASWTDDMRAATSERSKALWEKRRRDGWVMPAEARQKLSERVISEETRQKLSEAAKGQVGRTKSAETRQKIAAKTAAQWQDPAIREKRRAALSAAQKARHASMTEAEREAFNEIRRKAGETRRARNKDKQDG